ncbi:uncharacterized protein Z519_10550 [Cladophialophora bantiana CBS 173.52]|uniref:HNH domain-containing protein n=1 Tax=Cladophialophora bantiana (strain ATCC 10958 / CBS 173.52 / CDC B-1940 / NIH 8579) TaxID=1442370 RepID=A0A0D2HE18_CLAB1|nr:uncharacterized protein Z519_10550 [Cladophialophora bantiana CBS 173.52]KIW89065.1 hypothetical protein Z519_10550 [Cladophialophora bantiana CBS 173.52]
MTTHNFDVFSDCLCSNVVEKLTDGTKKTLKRSSLGKKTRQNESDPEQSGPDPSELADFSDYLATDIFSSLPEKFQALSHQALRDDIENSDKWSLPLTLTVLEELSAHLPEDIHDSLTAYGLIEPPKSDMQSFMAPVFSGYISAVTTPPPKWAETRTKACEICERDWVPVTYHHLIPKQVHAKVLKRNWHEEHRLNSVAWLCRACHSFVHRMASNEELARKWYTVDLICQRGDIQKWSQWVGRIRWKKT